MLETALAGESPLSIIICDRLRKKPPANVSPKNGHQDEIMKKLLALLMITAAMTACGKKEEAPATSADKAMQSAAESAKAAASDAAAAASNAADAAKAAASGAAAEMSTAADKAKADAGNAMENAEKAAKGAVNAGADKAKEAVNKQ